MEKEEGKSITHLNFGEGFAIYKIKNGICELRDAINKARTSNQPTVKYTISFYPKTRIYDERYTVLGDIFEVSLNSKTIYPSNMNGQAFTIINLRTKEII